MAIIAVLKTNLMVYHITLQTDEQINTDVTVQSAHHLV